MCDACDQAWTEGLKWPFRWHGHAIVIGACHEHAVEIQEALAIVQRMQDKGIWPRSSKF